MKIYVKDDGDDTYFYLGDQLLIRVDQYDNPQEVVYDTLTKLCKRFGGEIHYRD